MVSTLLSVIYHSPNNDSLNFDLLCSLLTHAVDIGVLVVCDFNAPYINWTSLTVTPANTYNEAFISLLDDRPNLQKGIFHTHLIYDLW